MKTVVIIALTIFAANIKAQEPIIYIEGPHGGTMKCEGDYKIEMLTSYKQILVYLYDKDVKSIANKGINGEVLFFYADDVSLSMKLKANESDGFVVEAADPDYFYCVVKFNIYGKTITTKFENQLELVEKEDKK
ncbi:MAG TPA: hypothetical protein VN026_05615 [Bacteroidia bacterium]|jgi:hypothetical protein|nr:hypothetical protein [Bacteroidia bacterium]